MSKENFRLKLVVAVTEANQRRLPERPKRRWEVEYSYQLVGGNRRRGDVNREQDRFRTIVGPAE